MTQWTGRKSFKFIKHDFKSLLISFQQRFPRYLIVCIICAVIIRLICVPNKSVDYKYFLAPWYDFIVSNGGFSALKYINNNSCIGLPATQAGIIAIKYTKKGIGK